MKEWNEYATYVFEHKDTQYELELKGIFHEEMYGQDADGNRGELRSFCDDVEVEEIDPIPDSQQLHEEVLNAFYDKVKCDDIDWKGGPEE